MSDVILSPNMSLPVPVVSVEIGPDWANDINACMSGIDGHNHTSGSGVPITPDAIDINEDLPFSSHNATEVRSVRYQNQSVVFSDPQDIGCSFVLNGDFYYIDTDGNVIRITENGSVTGAAGTITGLPSGTASASYAAGTFTFRSATNTPASMAVGPLIIGRVVASSPTVTLAPSGSQVSNFSVTFFPSLPAGTRFVTVDASGQLSFSSSASTGSGGVVLQTSPTITTPTINGGVLDSATVTSPTLSGTISGAAAGIIAADVYTPTGTGAVGTWTLRTAFYQRINNIVSVSVFYSVTANGSGAASLTITLPIARSGGNFTTTFQIPGAISPGIELSLVVAKISSVPSAQTALIELQGSNNENYTVGIVFTYSIT